MLLLMFLLIPAVLADLEEKTINNYVIKIDGNTLKSVQPTATSSHVLNLSGLGLQFLENNVFDNLSTVKNLDLGNNSLRSIPSGIFSKLENLEYLNLANNNIDKFYKSFEGLDHLKTLNISNNPLTKLRGCDLHGLSKSSVVITKGLDLESINAYVFEENPGAVFAWASHSYDDPDGEDDNYKIKICINDGVLTVVDHLRKNETLPSDCQLSKVNKYRNMLNLDNRGIVKFKKGWFKLEIPIFKVNLEGNNIVDVTSELLNEIPRSVLQLDISKNKIERLNRGIINRSPLRSLILNSNRISEIETDALANMTILFRLDLNDNLLSDMKFVASLPSSVIGLSLKENRITEIPPGLFSRFVELHDIYLDGNLIQEIKPDVFDGLSELFDIGLSNNRISNIAAKTFQQTRRLMTLNLSNNSISSFEKGTFDNLRITTLDVSHNKLSSIKKNFPDGLPPHVEALILDFNEIENLEYENLEKLQELHILSVSGNKISEIKPGTFDSGTLYTIILNKNLLNVIDVESFRGLRNLDTLLLAENGITSVPKGLLKHMPGLSHVDLSKNPIKRLQNGTFNGLQKSSYSEVRLQEVPLEVIEGGLFDDV